jgi:hypothetical protein
MTCPLCVHEKREHIEQELAKGNMSKKMVGKELEMTVEEVHEHMMNHFSEGITKVDLKPSKLREAYNKKDILLNTMIQLKERLDYFMTKDTFSPNETKQIVSMAQELRHCIMDLANLEDELKSEQHITINMYNNLKMMVLSALCPNCRKLVMAELEVQEKKVIDEIDLTGLEVAKSIGRPKVK